MSTARNLITLAFRESNYKAVGVEPTANELAEGLTLLQGLVDSVFGIVIGTKLMSWYVPWGQNTSAKIGNYPSALPDRGIPQPSDVTLPPANVRLMMKNTEATTIYFQYQPQDGAMVEYVDLGHTETVTLDANGSLFGLTGGDTTVQFTSDFPTNRNTRKRWMYRADIGSWVELTALTLDDDIPFPEWFDDYWITALSIRLSPRYGNDARGSTMDRHREMRVFLSGQYEQSGLAIIGSPGGKSAMQSFGGSSDMGSMI